MSNPSLDFHDPLISSMISEAEKERHSYRMASDGYTRDQRDISAMEDPEEPEMEPLFRELDDTGDTQEGVNEGGPDPVTAVEFDNGNSRSSSEASAPSSAHPEGSEDEHHPTSSPDTPFDPEKDKENADPTLSGKPAVLVASERPRSLNTMPTSNRKRRRGGGDDLDREGLPKAKR